MFTKAKSVSKPTKEANKQAGAHASIQMMKRQCDRVDTSFIGVSATTRFVSPRKRRFKASSSESAAFTCPKT